MICAFALYALLMLLWPIIVSVNRGAVYRIRIVCLALILPILFISMELLMALCVVSADEVHGIVLYTPTLLAILYIPASLSLVIWAYRGRTREEPRGFPVVMDGNEPTGTQTTPVND